MVHSVEFGVEFIGATALEIETNRLSKVEYPESAGRLAPEVSPVSVPQARRFSNGLPLFGESRHVSGAA